jgi:PAS domain S-box-containing protein
VGAAFTLSLILLSRLAEGEAQLAASTTAKAYVLLASAFVLAYAWFPFLNSTFTNSDVRRTSLSRTEAYIAFVTAAFFFSINSFLTGNGLTMLVISSMLLLVYVTVNRLREIKAATLRQAHHTQKEQLDTILSSIDEVIWSIDAETHELLYTNNACLHLFGYKPEEMMADKDIFFDSIHPDDREMFYASVATMKTNGFSICDFRIRHRNGSIRYLRGQGRINISDDGNRTVLSGIASDITGQRLAEDELLKKTNEMRNILESISDGFFTLDTNGVMTYANGTFGKIAGRDAHSLIGQHYTAVIPQTLQPKFRIELEIAQLTGSGVGFEIFCDTLGKWLSFKMYPAENGVSIYFTDITEEMRLFEQVRNDEQKLRVRNTLLSEVAWMQSHKVRAPLANILGLIPLLNFDDPTDADNAYILDGIKASGETLDGMIREISGKLSRLELGEEYQKLYTQG